MEYSTEQRQKIDRIQEILDYKFNDEAIVLYAITHPSATEGKPARYSYERLEFLGDAVLGTIVVHAAFSSFPELDEGGLTRIKVSLVSGSTLSKLAEELGFKDVIVFGSSETGTGKRGMHSALENVYEAVVGALYLDGGMDAASRFVTQTLIPRMDRSQALRPENPKSMLQEKLQEHGVTPTYELLNMDGPPHDRTFEAQVFAEKIPMGKGIGKSKKEAEAKAAKQTLEDMSEYIAKIEKSKKKFDLMQFTGELFKIGELKKNRGNKKEKKPRKEKARKKR
jgi:ribonuclease III